VDELLEELRGSKYFTKLDGQHSAHMKGFLSFLSCLLA
jgi:hypothetical protein